MLGTELHTLHVVNIYSTQQSYEMGLKSLYLIDGETKAQRTKNVPKFTKPQSKSLDLNPQSDSRTHLLTLHHTQVVPP